MTSGAILSPRDPEVPMTSYRLTYFDMAGGRGESLRIALHAAGIPFDDHRVPFAEFGEMRHRLRFGALPVLEIDDAPVTQSNALARFIGRIAGLYPEDALQALWCDETMDAVEDALHAIDATFGLEGEALKEARRKLVSGRLTMYLRGLGELLARGGDWFADERLTVADLKVLMLTRWLDSGKLDHVPTDLVERVAPALAEHRQRAEADPIVAGYYAARP